MMRSPLHATIRLAVGIGLLALLFLWVDLQGFWATIQTAAPAPLAGAFLLLVGVMLLDAVRLRITFGRSILPLRQAVTITLVGVFFGTFTPGLVGAELYKVASLARGRDGLMRLVGLITSLRALGLFSLFFWALTAVAVEPDRVADLWAVVQPRWDQLPQMMSPAVLVTGITAMILLGLLVALGLRSKWIVQRLREPIRQMVFALVELESSRLGALLLLSLAIGLLRIGVLDVLVVSFGTTSVEWGDAALVMAVAMIAMALPISIGGLGVQEAATAGLLTLFGVPTAEAVAVSICQRALVWMIALVGAAFFVWNRKSGGRGGP